MNSLKIVILVVMVYYRERIKIYTGEEKPIGQNRAQESTKYGASNVLSLWTHRHAILPIFTSMSDNVH